MEYAEMACPAAAKVNFDFAGRFEDFKVAA